MNEYGIFDRDTSHINIVLHVRSRTSYHIQNQRADSVSFLFSLLLFVRHNRNETPSASDTLGDIPISTLLPHTPIAIHQREHNNFLSHSSDAIVAYIDFNTFYVAFRKSTHVTQMTNIAIGSISRFIRFTNSISILSGHQILFF